LNRAVRTPPTCKYPVGEGANRTRTPLAALLWDSVIVCRVYRTNHNTSV
jgi:hypothetical protein